MKFLSICVCILFFWSCSFLDNRTNEKKLNTDVVENVVENSSEGVKTTKIDLQSAKKVKEEVEDSEKQNIFSTRVSFPNIFRLFLAH